MGTIEPAITARIQRWADALWSPPAPDPEAIAVALGKHWEALGLSPLPTVYHRRLDKFLEASRGSLHPEWVKVWHQVTFRQMKCVATRVFLAEKAGRFPSNVSDFDRLAWDGLTRRQNRDLFEKRVRDSLSSHCFSHLEACYPLAFSLRGGLRQIWEAGLKGRNLSPQLARRSNLTSPLQDSLEEIEDLFRGHILASMAFDLLEIADRSDQDLPPSATLFEPVLEAHEQGMAFWWATDHALHILLQPSIYRNAEGRLHREGGPAIEWPDFGAYYWHGVHVPDYVVMNSKSLTSEMILNEGNSEVRRVMLERGGFEVVSEEAEIVDCDPVRGTLYHIVTPPSGGGWFHRPRPGIWAFVRVTCPSTDRKYYLMVPPDITTVGAAIAWTFDLTPETYQPALET